MSLQEAKPTRVVADVAVAVAAAVVAVVGTVGVAGVADTVLGMDLGADKGKSPAQSNRKLV
jgi:hypothetical protein